MKKLRFVQLFLVIAFCSSLLGIASCAAPSSAAPNKYTITFDANGGVEPEEPITQVFTEKVSSKLTKNEFTREGFSFLGWATESSATTATFTDEQEFSATASVTLYAIWKACDIDYKVEYYKQNVDCDAYELDQEISFTTKGLYDTEITIPTTKFAGFTQEKVEGDKTVKADGSSVVKIYLNRKTITIKLNTQSSEETMEPLVGVYGAKVTAPNHDPIRTGYDFKNWSPEIPETFPANDITCVAVWKGQERTYKVEYYKQNILLNEDYEKVEADCYSDEAAVGSEIEPLEKNYPGFHRAGTGGDYSVKIDGSSVLKVYYDRNLITLNFDTNGGSIVEPITGAYQTNVVLSSNPTKIGYEFDSWSEEILTFPLENKTYTALWTPVTYTITYMDGTNTISSLSKNTYTIEENVTLESATKNGYVFDGWYEDEDLSNKVTQIPLNSTGDKIFYAKFVGNTSVINVTILDNSDIDVEYSNDVAVGQNITFNVKNASEYSNIKWSLTKAAAEVQTGNDSTFEWTLESGVYEVYVTAKNKNGLPCSWSAELSTK